MIFTLFYMYATVLQWWRLGSLKNKLSGTLNTKNALLLSSSKVIHTNKRQRSIENLLFHVEDRIACTVVPKQNVNLSHWISFPRNPKLFPIHIELKKCTLKPPFIYLMIRSVLDSYSKHESEVIQIERFGELVAWKATSKFEILLKTDMENLTKLVHLFSNNAIDINHDLEMLELEVVTIDGRASKIKYERKYSRGETMKFSHSPVHWKKFASEVRDLYLKIRENSNPKIKIENGASRTEDHKIIPVHAIKPMKKESKKQTEDKNTLEVSGVDHRRHKSGEKKEKTHDEKHKADRKVKDESRIKEVKTETKSKPRTVSVRTEVTNKSKEKVVDIEKDKIQLQEKCSMEPTHSETNVLSDKNVELKENLDHKEKEETDKTETTELKKAEDITIINADNAKSSKSKEVKETTVECKEVKNLENSIYKGNVKPVAELRTTPEFSNFDDAAKISNGSKSDTTANVKPPNILVYADSVTAKENVKTVLNSVINSEKYIVYDLPTNLKTTWGEPTALVVICGATTPDLTFQLLQYLVSGGQLLCLCSDLLHSILTVFSTAEVREHELVRFSYGEWKRVKMMHHIFCYQASPAKKQFSKDSVESNHSNGSSPIAPRTPSTAEIQHNGKNYTLQVQVLGTEETWQTPSLLLANVKNSKGRAVFSQVHLEIDPMQFEGDETKFTALKDSNTARIQILTDILKNRLDIDCTKPAESIKYTPAYFLGRHDMKIEMLNECKEIVNDTLECGQLTVEFCGKHVDPGVATATRLPVILFSCPSSFSTVEYFSTLETDFIGRLVIYADVLTCSQYLLSKTLRHGLVIITRQQSASIGRSNNKWLSPVGSACFSLQLHIPLSSPLGRMLSLIQHLVSVAVVEALKKNPGYEKLDVGIKWPNDIYINKTIKVGGLLVTSTVGNRIAVLNIGCGFNLDNPKPTVCLNDYLEQYNKDNNKNLLRFTHEKYYAMVFNEIENLYDIVQNDDLEHLYNLYYKHWMHKDAKIKIQTEEGLTKNAKIIGIDDFGFLKVELENGEVTVVQPDGNTFDMTKGLIAPKPSYKT